MGRPKKPEGERVRRVVAYLEPHVYQKLQKLALLRGDANVNALAARELRAVAARRLPRGSAEVEEAPSPLARTTGPAGAGEGEAPRG